MRSHALCLLFLMVLPGAMLAAPVKSVAADTGAFGTPEAVLDWMYGYRDKPEPARLPAAIQALRKQRMLEDQEKAGFFVGFIAGVLGDNPRQAQALVAGLFPMPPKEQSIIVKAIAYSDLEDWPDLLFNFAERMSERQPLIDKFLSGQEPLLMQVPLESGTPHVYTLWGYHVATGYHGPVLRIIAALRWSRKADEISDFSWSNVTAAFGFGDTRVNLDQLTVGSTAKWTLVSYAERDRDLIDVYRAELKQQPEVAEALQEVIDAAHTYDGDRIRKEEAIVIETAKRHNFGQPSAGSRAANAGSIGIATACVVAGATGQMQVAVPCVITGAVYSGVVRLFSR